MVGVPRLRICAALDSLIGLVPELSKQLAPHPPKPGDASVCKNERVALVSMSGGGGGVVPREGKFNQKKLDVSVQPILLNH